MCINQREFSLLILVVRSFVSDDLSYDAVRAYIKMGDKYEMVDLTNAAVAYLEKFYDTDRMNFLDRSPPYGPPSFRDGGK